MRPLCDHATAWRWRRGEFFRDLRESEAVVRIRMISRRQPEAEVGSEEARDVSWLRDEGLASQRERLLIDR